MKNTKGIKISYSKFYPKENSVFISNVITKKIGMK